MSVLPSADSRSVIVTRLRSAGCVFAEDEARLLISTARTPAELDAMVERRISGLPLEHVLGWAEFSGLRIALDPGVFIPRRRTEFLVEVAMNHARPAKRTEPGPVVLDLCCGSGALGVAVATKLAGRSGQVELHAADIDPVAVRCARRNLAAVGGRAHLGDLYQPLPPDLRGRVDILLANVPYVPTDAVALLPAEAREHEPRIALDGGPDGLAVTRRVAAGAPAWLAPGGRLLTEASERQAARIAEVFAAAGLVPSVAHSADLDATVVVGTASGG
ncbi:putative protein N(5)-glutamine methyltransferase [Amycolatopsis taiwanensis]|uniref:putative protein N(5)-glutamine methyltransferase n=1 Tax=Amycolatopsis taiwanensis TaxID=342230 RepID=UPI0004869CD4|nr:putative protein N(5)-glutamine methyltransferase [Amycolatopsis taiwanensis]